jgi:hypothetical protein
MKNEQKPELTKQEAILDQLNSWIIEQPVHRYGQAYRLGELATKRLKPLKETDDPPVSEA